MTNNIIQDKPFTVQAGKRYVRRDGEISGVISENENQVWHFADRSIGFHYRHDGSCALGENIPRPEDLISEYIPEETLEVQFPASFDNSTAEPQDEWGPWMYISNEDYEVPDIFEGIETVYRDGKIRKWRLKKEPEVIKTSVWLDENYEWWLTPDSSGTYGDYSEAIITLTDGKLDIDWADE